MVCTNESSLKYDLSLPIVGDKGFTVFTTAFDVLAGFLRNNIILFPFTADETVVIDVDAEFVFVFAVLVLITTVGGVVTGSDDVFIEPEDEPYSNNVFTAVL